MRTFFALKKWRKEYFDDVIKCHALVCTWSIASYQSSMFMVECKHSVLVTKIQCAYIRNCTVDS